MNRILPFEFLKHQVNGACWADDLRDIEGDISNFNWHFIDLPFIRDSLTTGISPIDLTNNVGWAVQEAIDILNSTRAFPASTMTRVVMLDYIKYVLIELNKLF